MTEPEQIPEPNDKGRVADATDANWVDRYCPAWSRPYLRLSRADRPAGTWLLLLPCWWGLGLALLSEAERDFGLALWIAAACAVGAFLMRGAGCTWNDISDRDIDAKVTRTKSRPLPSGQVTTWQAAFWLALQLILALGVLLTLNSGAIVLGFIALAPVVIYPFAKRFTWWPQIFLGVAFNWGALLGWVAYAGHLGWPAVYLYLAGISWTLFYDTIYAHQDKEDDALIGVKSTARLFADNTPAWLRGFLMGAVGLMGLAVLGATIGGNNILAMVVALGGVWAFGWHLLWQLQRLNIDSPEVCLRLFRSNRDAGLIPVIFFVIAMSV